MLRAICTHAARRLLHTQARCSGPAIAALTLSTHQRFIRGIVPLTRFAAAQPASLHSRLLHSSAIAAATATAPATSHLPAHAHQWLDERPERPDLSFRHRNAVRSNVVLLGPPGSGKTSVGRILASLLGKSFVDVDDDVLEPAWKCSVADKLRAVGDRQFVTEEGEALMRFETKHTVLSLTGSNPLHARSLEHVGKDGVLVYLDIAPEEILARCERMKVDRIVGQSSSTLANILAYRRVIYENSYDLRVLITPGETPEAIAKKIAFLLHHREQESYVSTRGYTGASSPSSSSAPARLDFLDVVAQGLSPDKGLFVPAHLENMRLTSAELARLQGLPYAEVALRVMERFPLGDRMHPTELRRILYEGYSSFNKPEVLPVTHLAPKIQYGVNGAAGGGIFHPRMFLMEMFHGPTASFKDLSLQLLPKLLQAALSHKRDSSSSSANEPTQRVGLLVATSGDTGTAALDGFARAKDMPVMVLYPHQGVSSVQRAQMQTSPGKVLVLGIEGADFDWCQGLVKEIFNDSQLRQHFQTLVPNLLLSSANSMNWGRFLPQVVYAVSSYLQLVARGEITLGEKVDVVYPTGNFGNILGALYARKVLGLPLGKVVCASNTNNILFEFLETGKYDRRSRELSKTVSPSIDILVSSNLERFLHLISGGGAEVEKVIASLFEQLCREEHFSVPPEWVERIKKEVQAGWVSEQECLNTIRETHERTGQLIDPHTAVGVHVANKLLAASPRTPVLVASTAHYGKFPTAMCDALGKGLITLAYSPADANDLGAMLRHLSTLSPSYAASMHPQLAELARMPVLHADRCDATKQSVLKHITAFLADFQTHQQAQEQAGRSS